MMKRQLHSMIKNIQKVIKRTIVGLYVIIVSFPIVYAQNSNFDSALQEAIKPVEKNLNNQFGTVSKGAQ